MKTSKLLLIAGIIIMGLMSMTISHRVNAAAIEKPNPELKVAYLQFDQAVQNSGILRAMYEQLDNMHMTHNWPYYTEQISYMGTKVYITGNYEQWYFFFKDRLVYIKTHQQ